GVNFVVEVLERLAAILGAFSAHLRAAAAVGVVMLGAFLLAYLAGVDAGSEDGADELSVFVAPPAGDPVGHLAHVGAVHAQPDAAAHVDFLGTAGVGA